MDQEKKYPIAEPDLTGNEIRYVNDAILNEGRISSSGKYLDQFEKYAKQNFQREFALSCSNGTTALHLALLGLGIGQGDEVIVPTLTFAATAAVVVHVGGTPIFVDVKDSDWLIDETKLDSLLTQKTKAIIIVDLYGLPCNYEVIEFWCKKNNIFLIEDSAEAHGAIYKGRKVGSFGDASCFSFFGNKIITTGEGGIVLTDNEFLFEKMKVLKNHGTKNPGTYLHEIAGYNYRMTNIQAAIGCAQFERFQEFLKVRKEHHDLYVSLLDDVPEISFQKFDPNDVTPAYWLETIRLSVPKEDIMLYLKEKGIDTRPVFIPMHKQKAYEQFVNGKSFPNSDRISSEGLSLPSSTLLNNKDIIYIAQVLKEAIALSK